MNFIQDEQLIQDAKSLGFDDEPYHNNSLEYYGYTLQQLEEWLWKRNKFLIDRGYQSVWGSHKEEVYFGIVRSINGDELNDFCLYTEIFDNPFFARLEGVKQAIKHLKGKQ